MWEFWITKCLPRITVVNGHWLWTGGINKDGYGQVCFNGRTIGITRFVIALMHCKDLDSDFHVRHIDNLCRHRNCCAPWHIKAGTRLENIQDTVSLGSARGKGQGLRKVHIPWHEQARRKNQRSRELYWEKKRADKT